MIRSVFRALAHFASALEAPGALPAPIEAFAVDFARSSYCYGYCFAAPAVVLLCQLLRDFASYFAGEILLLRSFAGEFLLLEALQEISKLLKGSPDNKELFSY